jgi:predicted aspartyl protease
MAAALSPDRRDFPRGPAGEARRRVCRLAGIALAVLALPVGAHPPSSAPPGACRLATLPAADLLVRVPFDVVDGRVYVQARANGQGPFRFAVDTGASGTGRLDASLASTLRLRAAAAVENSDGVQTQTAGTTHLDSLALGGLVRRDADLITRDYAGKMAPKARFAGILGRDFFADGLLVIDYPHRTLSFTRSHGLSPKDAGAVTYQRPFRVATSIGSLQTEANLDTGANASLVLPAALYPRVEASGLSRGPKGRLTNTVIDMQRTRVKGPVRIGAIALADVDALVLERFPEVLVGSRILSRFVLVIDQRNRSVALCPGD